MMKKISHYRISRIALMTSLGFAIAAKATASQIANSQQQDSGPTLEITTEDRSYYALTSLLKRYNCPADPFLLTEQSLSRMQFAIALKACSGQLRTLALPSLDLKVLQNLEQEFSAELKILNDRADSLEARTTILEPQQFSTTTKMTPTVVFAFPFVADQPTDWEFAALRSLAERYQCNLNHKKQNMARMKFAADLRLCLDQAHQRGIKREDLAIFNKLEKVFSVELLHLTNSGSDSMQENP
jgi:hypothetical protein